MKISSPVCQKIEISQRISKFLLIFISILHEEFITMEIIMHYYNNKTKATKTRQNSENMILTKMQRTR